MHLWSYEAGFVVRCSRGGVHPRDSRAPQGGGTCDGSVMALEPVIGTLGQESGRRGPLLGWVL